MCLAKHNIKDRFYHMFLQAQDCLHLVIVLPCYAREEPCVAISMSCIMDWVQSLPTFSAMSETVAVIANANFWANPQGITHHCLDQQLSSMD